MNKGFKFVLLRFVGDGRRLKVGWVMGSGCGQDVFFFHISIYIYAVVSVEIPSDGNGNWRATQNCLDTTNDSVN